ncbi:alpha/beta hydrolase [Spirosoma luteolum]
MRPAFTRLLSVLWLTSLLATRTWGQSTEPIHYTITTPAQTGLTLDGSLTLPQHPAGPPTVLLIVGGVGPTDRNGNSAYGLASNAYQLLADSLVGQGLAVARYDKRYAGTNRTAALARLPKAGPTLDETVSDAVGFIRLLQADRRFKRVLVLGHDEGSLVGMLAARQAEAHGLISLAGAGRNLADLLKEQLAPPGAPADIRAEIDGLLDSLRAGQVVHPRSVQFKAQFAPVYQPIYRSWMRYDPAEEIRAFGGPVLIIQGGRDTQLSPADAQRLRAARPADRFVLVDQMTHQLKADAGTSLTGNRQTYNKPGLALAPGVASLIATFARQ